MEAGVLSADRGVGPLLQRDYWAVLADCKLTPSQLILEVKRRFCDPVRIEARWRRGDLPNWRSRVGFILLSGYYQLFTHHTKRKWFQ